MKGVLQIQLFGELLTQWNSDTFKLQKLLRLHYVWYALLQQLKPFVHSHWLCNRSQNRSQPRPHMLRRRFEARLFTWIYTNAANNHTNATQIGLKFIGGKLSFHCSPIYYGSNQANNLTLLSQRVCVRQYHALSHLYTLIVVYTKAPGAHCACVHFQYAFLFVSYL